MTQLYYTWNFELGVMESRDLKKYWEQSAPYPIEKCGDKEKLLKDGYLRACNGFIGLCCLIALEKD